MNNAKSSSTSNTNKHTSNHSLPLQKLGLTHDALPRHIAIIMDGNGRWAKQRGQHRMLGHTQGASAVKPIVTQCAKLGIDALTLYSFSTENWKRPDDEVTSLMTLCCQNLESERQLMIDNNIRFAHLGQRQNLPTPLLDQLDKTLAVTANNTGLTLSLAFNYSSRREITDAVHSIAAKVKQGSLNLDDIIEQTITDNLYSHSIPDPDLLIRTAGEIRISNFLLWQISYTELWFTDTLWPDFSIDHLHDAIQAFAKRQRRFGNAN